MSRVLPSPKAQSVRVPALDGLPLTQVLERLHLVRGLHTCSRPTARPWQGGRTCRVRACVGVWDNSKGKGKSVQGPRCKQPGGL